MSSADELRSIANQLRELGKTENAGALDVGGLLLADAIDRGAFASIDYLQLRHILDFSHYPDPRRAHCDAFMLAVEWLAKHIQEPPTFCRRRFPMLSWVACPEGYVKTNLSAVASLIDQEVERLDSAEQTHHLGLEDPLEVAWIAKTLTKKQGGGRSDKIGEKMTRKGCKVVQLKKGGKRYCEKAEALRVFPGIEEHLSPADPDSVSADDGHGETLEDLAGNDFEWQDDESA